MPQVGGIQPYSVGLTDCAQGLMKITALRVQFASVIMLQGRKPRKPEGLGTQMENLRVQRKGMLLVQTNLAKNQKIQRILTTQPGRNG